MLLPADKPCRGMWCLRHARVLVPPNLYIHTYIRRSSGVIVAESFHTYIYVHMYIRHIVKTITVTINIYIYIF